MNKYNTPFHLLKKSVLFMLVISFFLFFIFEFILYRIGEIGDYEKIIIRQIQSNLLLGQGLTDESLEYKIKGTLITKPDFLVLGTSRILGISNKNFDSYTFYNAGISASVSGGLDGMITLIKSLPINSLPKYVFIGLDPWLFNPNYPNNRTNIKQKIKSIPLIFNSLKFIKYPFQQLRSYKSLIKYKHPWVHYVFQDRSYNGYGLNAKVINAGFAPDGSFQKREGYKKTWVDANIIYYKKQLLINNFRFPAASHIHKYSLEKLKSLLSYLKNNNIYAIGFLPPFSPNSYSALTSMDDRSLFYHEYEENVCLAFKSYDYNCFNFTDIQKSVFLEDHHDDFSDFMHPGNELLMKITNHIISSDPKVKGNR
jgi:hypothetical protein